MEQKITIRIADRSYTLKANGPEHEELIRLAAEQINARITSYQSVFIGKTTVDILSFAALNEGIGRLALERQLQQMQGDQERLNREIEVYLDNLEK